MSHFQRQKLNKLIDHFLEFVREKCENFGLTLNLSFDVLVNRSYFSSKEINGTESDQIRMNLDFLSLSDFSKFVEFISRYYDTYKTEFILNYIISWFNHEIIISINSQF